MLKRWNEFYLLCFGICVCMLKHIGTYNLNPRPIGHKLSLLSYIVNKKHIV